MIYSWERLPGYISKIWCDTIKQIRVFGGLILQPEMKPPKIVTDPAINTERDESSQSHHTVLLRHDPSGTSTPFRLRPEGAGSS